MTDIQYWGLILSFLMLTIASVLKAVEFAHAKKLSDDECLRLRKQIDEQSDSENQPPSSYINCPIYSRDLKRIPIIDRFHPDLYLSLENSFLNSAANPSCNINVFPYINVWGQKMMKPEFVPSYGYKFDGRNMISVQMNHCLPHDKQARTFAFAVNPTEYPTAEKPMFFFSYGQRISHNCNDGISNHDKSFGVFWGEPKPKDPIPEKYKGIGVRVFFYCEHCKEDRTSDNCDTEVICTINMLNSWHIYVVTYDGSEVRFYQNGENIFHKPYDIKTSQTLHLNIGGFVHHDENGAIIARDLDYSMNGYIREFIMFRKVLSGEQIKELTTSIRGLVEP